MALASRHKLRLVVYGNSEPPEPCGNQADIAFRLRVDGTTPAELVDGFAAVLRCLRFDEAAIAAAFASFQPAPLGPEQARSAPLGSAKSRPRTER